MKTYIYVSIVIFLLFNCEKTEEKNRCFSNFLNPITLSLNSAEANNLLVPNGHTFINGGIRGIIVFNSGKKGNNQYKAYDLECPNRDCKQPMEYSFPVLKCKCDNSKFSVLDGSLQSGKANCSARSYLVLQNGNSLQILN